MGYTVRPGIKRGKPPLKYKHRRTLTGAERVRVLRAKLMIDAALDETPVNIAKYKKAIQTLESIYSEGVNPHERGALRTPKGRLISLHGFGRESTPEGKEEKRQE
jgi:hypothetical protein